MDDRTGTTKNSFFFAREIPYGMAIMRMVVPWTIMSNVIERWPWVREIYSADGAPAPLAANYGYPGFLPELSGGLAVVFFAALTVFLITASIGWFTRFSMLAVSMLYYYFGMMDAVSTITKYTVIFTHLTLLLGLSHCGAVWSVDSWLRRKKGLPPAGAGPAGLEFPIWAQRMLQLFLGFMYLGAAVTKMHTPAFFSGDQLMYWTMTYINNVHPLGDWLSQYPLFLSVMGYVTIVWEITFLFTVFQPKFKWWTLLIGALFHVMTAFTLGLFVFPLIMLGSYLAFLQESDVRRILAWKIFRGAGARWLDVESPVAAPADVIRPGWMAWGASAATFALVTAGVCITAVAVEHWRDPYHIRSAGGPLPLRKLTDDEIEQMLDFDQPIRVCDKLLAFDLGTIAIGEHLLDRCREFRHGERIIAQVTLNPPHEDMWVDCVLTEAKPGPEGLVPGRLMHKVGMIIPRELFRSNFWFRLDDAWEPGEYFLQLRSGSEEMARRRFTLKSKGGAALTN